MTGEDAWSRSTEILFWVWPVCVGVTTHDRVGPGPLRPCVRCGPGPRDNPLYGRRFLGVLRHGTIIFRWPENDCCGVKNGRTIVCFTRIKLASGLLLLLDTIITIGIDLMLSNNQSSTSVWCWQLPKFISFQERISYRVDQVLYWEWIGWSKATLGKETNCQIC